MNLIVGLGSQLFGRAATWVSPLSPGRAQTQAGLPSGRAFALPDPALPDPVRTWKTLPTHSIPRMFGLA